MKKRDTFKASELIAGDIFRMEEKKAKREKRREAAERAKQEAMDREQAA